MPHLPASSRLKEGKQYLEKSSASDHLRTAASPDDVTTIGTQRAIELVALLKHEREELWRYLGDWLDGQERIIVAQLAPGTDGQGEEKGEQALLRSTPLQNLAGRHAVDKEQQKDKEGKLLALQMHHDSGVDSNTSESEYSPELPNLLSPRGDHALEQHLAKATSSVSSRTAASGPADALACTTGGYSRKTSRSTLSSGGRSLKRTSFFSRPSNQSSRPSSQSSRSSDQRTEPSGMDTPDVENSDTTQRWQISDDFERAEAERRAQRQKWLLTRLGSSSSTLAPYALRALSRMRLVVKHSAFDYTVAAVLVASSVAVGVEVDLMAERPGARIPVVFEALQYLFCIFFVIEFVLRWLAEGKRFLGWPTREDLAWNWFDLMVVCFAVLELILEHMRVDSGPLVAARLIRILRFVRIIRMAPFLHDVKRMASSMLLTLRPLVTAIILMALIMYMFGICLTQQTTRHLYLLQGSVEPDDPVIENFGTIPKSIYTLFSSGLGGLSWSDLGWSLIAAETSVLPALFFIFITFMVFAFLNVITGFFCENAFETAKQNKEQILLEQKRNKAKYMREFEAIFGTVDADASGVITFGEFSAHIQDDAMQAYFSHLNLDVSEAWDIFRLLDVHSTGTVSLEVFVQGCLKLRGTAKAIDVAAVSHDVHRIQRKLTKFMAFVDHCFCELGVSRDHAPLHSGDSSLNTESTLNSNTDFFQQDESLERTAAQQCGSPLARKRVGTRGELREQVAPGHDELIVGEDREQAGPGHDGDISGQLYLV